MKGAKSPAVKNQSLLFSSKHAQNIITGALQHYLFCMETLHLCTVRWNGGPKKKTKQNSISVFTQFIWLSSQVLMFYCICNDILSMFGQKIGKWLIKNKLNKKIFESAINVSAKKLFNITAYICRSREFNASFVQLNIICLKWACPDIRVTCLLLCPMTFCIWAGVLFLLQLIEVGLIYSPSRVQSVTLWLKCKSRPWCVRIENICRRWAQRCWFSRCTATVYLLLHVCLFVAWASGCVCGCVCSAHCSPCHLPPGAVPSG